MLWALPPPWATCGSLHDFRKAAYTECTSAKELKYINGATYFVADGWLSKSSRKNRYVSCASHRLGTERPNVVKADLNTQCTIPAHEDTPWQVIVKTANPVRGTQEVPLGRHIEAVLEVQALMKGLLDLRRQDA